MEANQNPQDEDIRAREMLELLTARAETPAPGVAAEPRQEYVPKDRFDEVLERARRAEDQADRMIRQGLAGRQEQEPDKPEEWDDGVADQIMPILDYKLQQHMQRLEQRLDPIIQDANRRRGMEVLNKELPGFGDLQDEVKRRFDALPDDMKPQYDNIVGAKALYGEALAEKVARNQPNERRESSAARAHSVSGASGPVSDRMDPHGLSAEAFEKLLDRIREST